MSLLSDIRKTSERLKRRHAHDKCDAMEIKTICMWGCSQLSWRHLTCVQGFAGALMRRRNSECHFCRSCRARWAASASTLNTTHSSSLRVVFCPSGRSSTSLSLSVSTAPSARNTAEQYNNQRIVLKLQQCIHSGKSDPSMNDLKKKLNSSQWLGGRFRFLRELFEERFRLLNEWFEEKIRLLHEWFEEKFKL